MLRILGSPRRLCAGPTRREVLRAGGVGLLGLADFFRLREAQAARPERLPHFGRAKACILLYLYGSPSQLETFDPKPDAPVEVRGELGVIRSSLPGCLVGELLPRTSRVLDRVTVLRSLTHPYPLHGVAYALTGVPAIDVPMELNPRDPRHWPFIGSVVDHLERRRGPVPANLALPFPFSSRRAGEVPRAGPYAAFLGGAFDPVWTELRGEATRHTVKTLNQQKLDVAEPYMGLSPDARFELAAGSERACDIALDRLDARRSLVEQFDAARRVTDAAARNLDRHRARAFELLRSPQVREALDLGREPPAVRDAYGMTLFGQGALAARRLVEAGARFVTVFWDEYGLAGSAWDTHWEHFPRMRHELTPGFDRAFAGLIDDLDVRGLLDGTLVLVLSEHGRTPKLQNVSGGGRDHWSRAYSAVLAGGGIARGKVVGRTDRIAGDVVERAASPKDVLATAYHLLGIDPATPLTDRIGRPLPLVDGDVLPEVLAP
jgi:uncharacterized protein (DUF1501 family)